MSSTSNTSKKSWQELLHDLAENTWTISAWIWSAIIVAFAVALFSAIAAGPGDQKASFGAVVLSWLLTQQANPIREVLRVAILTIMVLFIAITLLAVLFRQMFKSSSESEWQTLLELLKKDINMNEDQEAKQKLERDEDYIHYLHFVERLNQNIRLRGFLQYSRTLAFLDLPLKDIFIPLDIVPDRPIYDAPAEQKRQCIKLEKSPHVSRRERDDYLRRLHFVWHSQVTQAQEKLPQLLPINEVTKGLTADNPVAIILGSPGSGKTTFLRWVALDHAQALLSPVQSPKPVHIPILLSIKDFADRIEREPISFKQFLISQVGNIRPNASTKVLEELEQGHCLILLDGLGESLSPRLHIRVLESVYEFIINYCTKGTQIKDTNHIIITSRIVNYDPATFSNYSHYTLLDFDDQKIELSLKKLWYVIERYKALSTQGTQNIAEKEVIAVGEKLYNHMWSLLEADPNLKYIAANPLILTIMILLQANGQDILHHRLTLYKVVTRAFIELWSHESRHKTLDEEDILQAEDVLSHLATHIHDDIDLLTLADIKKMINQVAPTFPKKQLENMREYDVTQIVEMIHRSGLFVEVGEDLFAFAYPSFQVYFAERSLSNKLQK